MYVLVVFFFIDTAPTEFYSFPQRTVFPFWVPADPAWDAEKLVLELFGEIVEPTLIQPTFVCDYPPSAQPLARDRKSTRLNSSHANISYAVFCFKKKFLSYVCYCSVSSIFPC